MLSMETVGNPHEQEIASLRDRIRGRREALSSMSERFSKESLTSEILALYEGEEKPAEVEPFPQVKASEEKKLLAILDPKNMG